MTSANDFRHPRISRRTAFQAGAIGLMGLGIDQLSALRAQGGVAGRAKACIYIFLSGGLAQHESFDMKPEGPSEIRGEFDPIATKTPGVQICEHLPMLAARSQMWSLCRSLTHSTNDHSLGHHIMLTGRGDAPVPFDPLKPLASDHPSIASIAGAVTPVRNNLPPAVMLPDKIVHNSGRVLPGQFAGSMGKRRDPFLVEAAPFHTKSYGAFPEYAFDHQERGDVDRRVFAAPSIHLPEWLMGSRLGDRVALRDQIENQQRRIAQGSEGAALDRHRAAALNLMTGTQMQAAFDVTRADERLQERYGKNAFGWSLLMAKRLVAAGVNLVQVNLGNNETWDTHGNAFPHLKNNLLPPTDRAVSALVDDLQAEGLLEDTLIVMAGEFGRTPKISLLAQHYKLPGRDHWGALQSVFFAGGGVQGGRVIGESDKIGAYPTKDVQKPENFAATIYHSLGLPKSTLYRDELERPHYIYHADPIGGLW
jgi:hypothetical protein